ncbi:MAG: hypothetical protein HQ495_05475 [Alphaproteobacteria bacterium]|nr:hypothetical protein [Alphaproteobacteria bacterium]
MYALRALLFLGLMGVATPAFSAEFKTMRLADRTRIDYAIALPPSFDPTIAYPLLLALPPGRQDDRMVLAGLDSYWEQAAAQLGYIVVSPVAPRLLFFRGSERFIPEFLERIGRDVNVAGRVHLAGVSNGGLSAFRIAGLFPALFQTLTVLPGFPPTEEDRHNLVRLKNIRVSLFVGETDQPWRDHSEETAATLRTLGISVSLSVIPGEGHFLRTLSGTGIEPILRAVAPHLPS